MVITNGSLQLMETAGQAATQWILFRSDWLGGRRPK
jgi:hypothetical protein